MSELALTLIRVSFLALLWGFVIVAILILRSDLRAPRDAKPLTAAKPSRRDMRAAGIGGRPSDKRRRTREQASKLFVTDGALAGTIVPLGSGPITIGRAPSSTLVIDDDYASQQHAQLVQSNDGQWLLEDLNSTNGTWLNRSRITSPTLVDVGMPIQVGQTTFELRA